MSDVIAGGAPAPAEGSSVVLSEQASTPNPISAQLPDTPEPAEKKPAAPSASEAVRMAMEKVEAKEKADSAAAAKAASDAAAKPPAKPDEPPGKTRGEDGKFAAREPQKDASPQAPSQAPAVPAPGATAEGGKPEARPSLDAPARFNEQGRADWANTPDSVKAEVHRAFENLEAGHAKYRESADKYERLREFDDTATRNGRDLQHSLRQVVEFERLIASNPVAAIDHALRQAGPRKQDGSPLTFMDIAGHVMRQPVAQQVQAIQSENAQLRAELTQMQQAQQIPDQVAAFAAAHPRMDEMAEDIAFLLQSGMIPANIPHMARLERAYAFAERFRPASGASSATVPDAKASSAAEAPASPAQTPPNPAGQKSVRGAPSSGAAPGGKKRTLSSSEAVSQAMAQAGL
ncbi:hypothetical protein FHS55_002638 [Angulomicrobium tetraedrale]|uniref:Uncharacterized protein n=1 Tax=Ancylobacter tetraedralis TaxID=217068 RepID=A0A839ZBA6_9HYPH|nr:hypothetical protein [Ancylobacter tetraedralis]MBB3772029.1 hypothetical protein [Ancylobacter tetraedralis]